MQFCYVILLCNSVLTLYKNLTLINTKLIIKILLCKTCFQRGFGFFEKKTHLYRKVWNSQKIKGEKKKVITIKTSATKVYQAWNFGISTALLLVYCGDNAKYGFCVTENNNTDAEKISK